MSDLLNNKHGYDSYDWHTYIKKEAKEVADRLFPHDEPLRDLPPILSDALLTSVDILGSATGANDTTAHRKALYKYAVNLADEAIEEFTNVLADLLVDKIGEVETEYSKELEANKNNWGI